MQPLHQTVISSAKRTADKLVSNVKCAQRTSHNEHDEEDDWETPEGDGHSLDSKVLHIVQLLQYCMIEY